MPTRRNQRKKRVSHLWRYCKHLLNSAHFLCRFIFDNYSCEACYKAVCFQVVNSDKGLFKFNGKSLSLA